MKPNTIERKKTQQKKKKIKKKIQLFEMTKYQIIFKNERGTLRINTVMQWIKCGKKKDLKKISHSISYFGLSNLRLKKHRSE